MKRRRKRKRREQTKKNQQRKRPATNKNKATEAMAVTTKARAKGRNRNAISQREWRKEIKEIQKEITTKEKEESETNIRQMRLTGPRGNGLPYSGTQYDKDTIGTEPGRDTPLARPKQCISFDRSCWASAVAV